MEAQQEQLSTFLMTWHNIMEIGSYVLAGFAILLFIYTKLKISGIKDNKAKYDFVSKHESRLLWTSHLCIAVAIAMYANTYKDETVALNFIWFFVRLFISVAIGTLYGYIAYLILQFYHPTRQAKRLKKYRYTPRINPSTGNKMRLLSEEEEDVYLDEGMQAEENIFSVDYDVWIDPDTKETKIEKYPGNLIALECDRCGFQTLKLEREEIIREATETREGEIVQHYKCSYCNRIKHKEKKLGKVRADGKFVVPENAKYMDEQVPTNKVSLVKVEIHAKDGEHKSFEFQNLKQAQKFLEEFDFDKVAD